ncbi:MULTISPECIES: MaoC family dehydratase [Myxococcus]|uniref:Dehydratase n=1 Tax=Myxococcus virescens TaxID=83456 RepID=A0A511HBF4_9BACT|nr:MULTISPECIES: MaoC family dehydratase [Myxococcus]WNZ58757.1 MaoC family dehydratase [Myxococcus sp. MxC21-1]GEL70880.1 dehydratase [Myxococcus virescens]SDE21476.1 Acyl dehydratase [Myxococcus virescens]
MQKSAYIQVGERRYREDKGLYLEDLEPGLIFEHRPGRTITATDNIWQSLINMNQHPIHINEHYAAETEFGRLLVGGLVTFNIVNGMTVSTVSQKAICHLGWDKVRFPEPVFVGDTLYAESEVLSRRNSNSRPGQGIVVVETRGKNQKDVTVVTFERSILIPSRDYVAKK